MLFRDEYWFLSNMYPCTVKLWGYTFRCSEAAYVAGKTETHNVRKQLETMNGFEAKKFGKALYRHDWDSIKVSVMREVLQAKFSQNPELLAKLKAVDGPIEETNWWNDRFWGVCQGSGQNHLGKLLMEIRDAA